MQSACIWSSLNTIWVLLRMLQIDMSMFFLTLDCMQEGGKNKNLGKCTWFHPFTGILNTSSGLVTMTPHNIFSVGKLTPTQNLELRIPIAE